MFLKHLLTTLTVLGAANAACFDNGDKEIGGSCYKFVAQKLTFADAQYWCHYQNPVTSSYLAYVPNQFTANFLASYARSAFETDDSTFWIGLSRQTSNSPWMWDNGQSLGYSNFGGQLGNNYAAESIVNAKWNTYGDADTNFFVCSYDPQAPPTFAPPGTTVPVPTTEGVTPTDGECTRRSKSTIFFAYSNDIDSYDVKNCVLYVYNRLNYIKFANVRFDVRIEEQIQYHADQSSFKQSVSDRLPDPTLGYTDNRGSDVLNVLQRFLDNTQAPLCGSLVYVLVGRYPDEADVSHLINQLRASHVFVYIIAKPTPSAGNNPKALFDIASATNGFCIFGDEQDFYVDELFGTDVFDYPYQYISQNYVVSGSGRIEMPVFPCPNQYTQNTLIIITLQDHALDNNVSVNYTIASVDGRVVVSGPNPNEFFGQYGTGLFDYFPINRTSDYKWTIDYSYPDNKPQRIEARMYSQYYHDFLPLPPI